MNQRERRVILEKLSSLKDIYVQVMYYRCLDQTVSEITNTLKLTKPKTVWTRFTKLFEQLQIEEEDKEAELIKKYSPILLEFIKSEEDLNNWGLIRAEMLRQASALPSDSEAESSPKLSTLPDSELPISEAGSTQNKSELPSTPQPSPQPTESQETAEKNSKGPVGRRIVPPWPAIAIPLLILCALGIAGVSWGWPIIGSMIENGITLAQATQTLELQAPTDTVASVPTQLPQLTAAPLPSPIPSTNTAIIQPTDTATSNPNVFLDDFDDGLDAAWTVVYGKPIIVNGQLTSSEKTLISIGDSTWKDYEIEFDVKLTGNLIQADSSYIGIRAPDIDNFLMFAFAGSQTEWSFITDGKNTAIPDTKTGDIDDRNLAHFVIRVEGNEIIMREHARLITSFINNDYQSGYLYLRFNTGTLYDNFKITLLNQ